MKRFLMFVFVLFAFSPLAYGQVSSNRYIVPNIVVGGGYRLEVTITNVMSRPTQVGIQFGSRDGRMMDLDVTDLSWPEALSHHFTSAYNGGDIPAKGSSRIIVSLDSDTLVTGQLIVDLGKNPSGEDMSRVKVVLVYAPSGTVVNQAEAPLTQSSLGFGFSASRLTSESQDKLETGIAISNINYNPANLTVKIRDSMGVEAISCSIVIPPYNQISKFISEFGQLNPRCVLPNSWAGGLIEVTSDQPVAATTMETILGVNGKFTFSTGRTFSIPVQ